MGLTILLLMLSELRKKLDIHKASLSLATRLVEEEEEALSVSKQEVEHLQKAQKIAQEVAKFCQESAVKQIEEIVTRCLSAVFGEDAYDFKISLVQKRGKTEAELLFTRDGNNIDPLSSAGGGVIDVASFSLRLACLILSKPSRRKLLILDEPFKMLSAEYRPLVADLLEQLAKEMNIQFIIVSHHEEMQIGKVIKL